jgi:hypothetical protein
MKAAVADTGQQRNTRISDAAKAAWRPRPVDDIGASLASLDDPEAEALKAKLAQVALNYAEPKRRRPRPFAAHRLRDLSAIIEHRFGGALPDDVVGFGYLQLIAHHAANLIGDQAANIRKRVLRWAPWVTETRLAALTVEAIGHPRKWKADTLAWRLGLKAAERRELKVTTIGATDMGRAARAKARKAAKMGNAEADRRAAGAVPRADWLAANSASRNKPWEAEGISRRTFYRRLAIAKAMAQVRGQQITPTHGGHGPVPLSEAEGLPSGCEADETRSADGQATASVSGTPAEVVRPSRRGQPEKVRLAACDPVKTMDLRHRCGRSRTVRRRGHT